MGRNPVATMQPMEGIIYGYYIRKNKLPELVNIGLGSGTNASKNNVNIYIDMVNIMEACVSNVTMMSHYDFAVGILNMVAHYATFFRSYPYNVEPMFYLIWSDLSKPVSHNKGRNIYGRRNERIYATKNAGNKAIIDSNIRLLKMVSMYLPNVKTICGTAEPHLITYNNIKRFEAEDIPNIVITKDIFSYQLPTISNTVIFRPKKSKGDDSSYCINAANAISSYLVDGNAMNDMSQKMAFDASAIPYTLWNLVAALCPPKQTDLCKSHSPREAIDAVLHNISAHKILGSVTITEVESRILEFPSKLTDSEILNVYQSLVNNWVLDTNYLYNTYLFTPESKDLSWNVVLKDNKGLKDLNDKVFRDTPVDFMGILNAN